MHWMVQFKEEKYTDTNTDSYGNDNPTDRYVSSGVMPEPRRVSSRLLTFLKVPRGLQTRKSNPDRWGVRIEDKLIREWFLPRV